MIASERKNYILDSLEKKGVVSTKDLAAELNTAEITIRRDFEKMEALGLLKRVQGGAIREGVPDVAELTMRKKSIVNSDAKKLVAAAAANLVNDGDSVFIDAGTSTAYLVDSLFDKKITIVTYSELITSRITTPIVPDIYMLGGRFIPGFSIYTGMDAQNGLRNYHFDIAFIGCTSLDFSTNAAYASDQDSIEFKKIAIANSERNYLLADHSKINRKAMLAFASLDRFDGIYCDSCETENHPSNLILLNQS